MKRDFTYIDDIVEGIVRLINKKHVLIKKWNDFAPDPGTSMAPYKVYDIGNNQSVELMRFIEFLEKKLDRKTDKEMLSIQLGNVPETYAEIDDLMADTGLKSNTSIE